MMITCATQLREVVDEAFAKGLVAMDTEFVWERTFFPQLGIIQLATSPESCYLIDVPAISDFSSLAKMIDSPKVEMIFHDAVQDLTILARLTGVTPRTVFDTRLAAGFAGMRSTLSLHDIVLAATEVSLSKTESRTNWLKRPLNPKQISYAIDDVKYLFAVREFENARIREFGNAERLAEDLAQLDRPAQFQERIPEEMYLRVKGVRDLTRRQLAVLRELTALREMVAMELDIPRPWVIHDRDLLTLVQESPESVNDLSIRKGAWGRDNRDHPRVMAAIHAGQNVPLEECPLPAVTVRDSAAFVSEVDALVQRIVKLCKPLGIDPQMVASRATIKTWVREGAIEETPGWRTELVSQAWQEIRQ